MDEVYDSYVQGTFVGTDGKTYLGWFDNGVLVDVIGEYEEQSVSELVGLSACYSGFDE